MISFTGLPTKVVSHIRQPVVFTSLICTSRHLNKVLSKISVTRIINGKLLTPFQLNCLLKLTCKHRACSVPDLDNALVISRNFSGGVEISTRLFADFAENKSVTGGITNLGEKKSCLCMSYGEDNTGNWFLLDPNAHWDDELVRSCFPR